RARRRALRDRDLTGLGERGDRHSARGSGGVAEPRVGLDLRDRILRCAAGENPQRRSGQQPGGVPGHRHSLLGPQGNPLIGAALRPIYQAESAAAAQARLEEFDRGPWGRKYPAIAQSWRRNWQQVIPFFAFAPEVRTILYTTNAIESLNSQVRKAVRIRGHFPSEEAATKLIWLV